MKFIQPALLACGFILSVTSMNTHAALYYRGNGMIYDSAQNITWMQNANPLAALTPWDSFHFVTWDDAKNWADGLTYGGFSDWRLPSAGLLNGNAVFSFDGSTDWSYQNTRSEIGHLYYELGNTPYCNSAGVCNPSLSYGFYHTSFVDAGTGNIVSFNNVQTFTYWEAEEYNTATAWVFGANMGLQGLGGKTDNGYNAWAVRTGDVAAVPVPAAAWLFGSSVIGLAGISTRRKKR